MVIGEPADLPELGTDPAEDAIASMAIFGRILTPVDDEHLELETPCEGWNVQALISHVVLGDAAIPLLFAGDALPGTMTIDTSILGPNPVATWRGTALAAIEAFRQPGAMEQVVQHPIGARPGSVVARFRMIDQLAHAWDLASAIGVEVEMPEALADAALDFLYPMMDQLTSSQVFGPPIAPPADSPAALRFLGLLGRKAW